VGSRGGLPIGDLAGAAAVVTGAGRGIGRGLSLEWAAAGMNVVVADVDAAAAERVAAEVVEAGRESLAVGCDVSDPAAVAELAALTQKRFGAVRMLCNNAGVFLDKPLLECGPDDWRRVLGVNLYGVIHGVEAFLPGMRSRGGPCQIVNTASDAGVFNLPFSLGDPEHAEEVGVSWGVYQVSKHAVVSYSEQLANALFGSEIGVAVLCPSQVATPMTGMHGIEPARVGTLTRQAVEQGRFYIFTEPTPRTAVELRFKAILEDFDR
jgi:NAD(P)-dependent dehydrogenase (short-subunit alcohol dehydrogenase family)